MDQAARAQNRRTRRLKVLLHSTLELPDRSVAVVLRDLSKAGALVCGDDLPKVGERVTFHRRDLSIASKVMWVHAGLAGLSFDHPLPEDKLLRHIPARQQKPVPPVMRRPGLAMRPLTTAERQLIEQWVAQSVSTLGD